MCERGPNFPWVCGFFTRLSSSIFLQPLSHSLCFWPKIPHFILFDESLESFYRVEEALIATLIIQPPDWSLPFGIMYNVSDDSIGQFWSNEETGKLMSYTMLARCSISHNKTTQPPRSYSWCICNREISPLPLMLQNIHLHRPLHH